jgi:hypothetical protein
MAFGILNFLMLAGLAGMAIPVIIHLLHRRRYNVVDWGAMQFLQISETTRRRLMLEELLLLLLRMGLIGVLVLALAAPFMDLSALRSWMQRTSASVGLGTGWVDRITPASLGRGNRDVVLVFDGSCSMGYNATGQSCHVAAKEWATAFVNDLAANDTVAVLQAREQVVPILGSLTHDLAHVRETIQELPDPAGACDWPLAIQAAYQILESSQRSEREIVVLTDNQRFGWADETTLGNWQLRAEQFTKNKDFAPRLWVVNLDPQRPKDPPNWALAPLHASQTVVPVGWSITFRTALVLHGQTEYQPPYRVRLEIDGQPVRDLPTPASAPLEKGQVTLSFQQAFATAGSHLVTVIVEPDPPPEQRRPGYVIKDHLPGDNRQDFAVDIVPALPVLLVDGDLPAVKRRGTDFLRNALAPAHDPTPVVLARVVSIQDFEPGMLTSDVGKEPGTPPRVLILSNVAHLTPSLQEAVGAFLAAGNGVLVTLGDRVDAKHYNDELHRGGQGWLPARLDGLTGDESNPERGARPLPSSFFHPALDLFRETAAEAIAEVRLPRWWKVSTPGKSGAVPVALLGNSDPLFIERAYQGGRVILATVPLDDSWHTNLTSLPVFVPLAHELIYYLAGARSADHNLPPGQPLRYWAESVADLHGLKLQPPWGPEKELALDGPADAEQYPATLRRLPHGLLVEVEGTRNTGVYKLTTGARQVSYYVARSDSHESDLTPCDDNDRARVARLVPMTYESDRERMAEAIATSAQRRDVWWLCLLGVIGLLWGEVWMTRRMARGR